MRCPLRLSTETLSPKMHVTTTANTVWEPEKSWTVRIRLFVTQGSHRGDIRLIRLDWEDLPERLAFLGLEAVDEAGETRTDLPLPIPMETGLELRCRFRANGETFGLIHPVIHMEIDDRIESTALEPFWLSMYHRAEIGNERELSDPLRQRLIEVVNARRRNGFIFLADFGAFFDDFLNIRLPETITAELAGQMGLPIEGLPVDPKTRLQVILGKKTFYGIEEFLLDPEEIGAECDDCFEEEKEIDPDPKFEEA